MNERMAGVRLPVLGLLVLGFVLGVALAVGCGGSGNDSNMVFADGAIVVRHIAHAPAKSESSAGVLIADVINTTYAAPDPNDVLLRISVRGTYTTTASSIGLTLSVRNGAGDLFYFTDSVTLSAGTSKGYLLSSSFDTQSLFPGTGVSDGTYRIRAQISNGDPGGSSIDLGTVELEVIAMTGVTRMDPSPNL